MQIFLWLFVSLILTISFTFVEVLILAVAINNLHYSLYFSILGIVGFLCWHRSWEIIKNMVEWNILFKIGGYFVFIILTIGCLALLANIVMLIKKVL
jgi:hypothetical protein